MDESQEKHLEQLFHVFEQNIRKLTALISQQDFPLTKHQFYIMNTLSKGDKHTVGELAEQMFVNPSAITNMMDRLIKTNYIERYRYENDRRVVYIKLTEEGRQIVTDMKKKRKVFFQTYLSVLSQQEIDELISISEKLASVPFPNRDTSEKE